MAFFEALGADTTNSRAKRITPQTRVADPFTESNMTWTVMGTTSEAWSGYYIVFTHPATSQNGVLLTATGATSSEVNSAMVPTHTSFRTTSNTYYVPIPVATSTQISVACSVASGPTAIDVQVIGVPSTNFDTEPSYSIMECGPFNLENVSGNYGKPVTTAPNATANTKNGYGELSEATTNYSNNVIDGASLGQTYDYLGLMQVDLPETGQSNNTRLMDVAYGAVSSETDIITNWFGGMTSNEIGSGGMAPLWVPWGRTSGDRISYKHQASTTDTNDGSAGLYLFGVR